jgi:glycosyltransferase involved in cell wall biosynthesis
MPGIGMYSAPLAMAISARSAVAATIADGFPFDVIDAHYFYPDGVAAALLAKWFRRPFVITARGSDITQLGGHRLPRAAIRWVANQAAAIVTVCAALKDELVRLGVDPAKVTVLRNGVDLTRFSPIDPVVARERFGLAADARVVASVGHLIPRKGHDLVIAALRDVPEATLLIAGEGPDHASLAALATRTGVAGRVRFLGQLAHDALPAVYSASDALVLASSNEGWANVLLEAMACGTPVVATDVGGSREVVAAPEAGILLDRRDSASIGAALKTLLAAPPARAATRRYAERFSWDETTHGQENLFASLGPADPATAYSSAR